MNRIEDVIAEVMAGHDDEAPIAADLLGFLAKVSARPASPGPRAPRRYFVPLTAAAAVAAIAIGSAWAGGLVGHQARPAPASRTAHVVKALSCPARYAGRAPWVPARPAHIDGRSRLVPLTTPSSAVICAYGSSDAEIPPGWPLSGRRTLRGGLVKLADLLTWEPRLRPGQPMPCTLILGPQTDYLIGLTYAGGGRLWVSATDDPNDCVLTSNGQFTSYGVIWPSVRRAVASGLWPARQPVSCSRPEPDSGRLGQDAVMVPPGSVSVTICWHQAGTRSSRYQDLVSALNALPTFPSTRGCSMTAGPTGFYQLLFSYPQGPPAPVLVLRACTPAIDNLSLQATSARTILPIILRLLGR